MHASEEMAIENARKGEKELLKRDYLKHDYPPNRRGPSIEVTLHLNETQPRVQLASGASVSFVSASF